MVSCGIVGGLDRAEQPPVVQVPAGGRGKVGTSIRPAVESIVSINSLNDPVSKRSLRTGSSQLDSVQFRASNSLQRLSPLETYEY